MTAVVDLSREAYLYAQDLDNLGGTEYWRVTAGGTTCERLLPTDPRLPAVRGRLDVLESMGRGWLIGGSDLPCRVDVRGDCVLTVRPLTRDMHGRISPVLLLFNALSPEREQAAEAVAAIPELMGRELAPQHLTSSVRIKRVLSWPRFLLLLHIAFFSRRTLNV